MATLHLSPLRYPGGKSKISSFIEDLINLNILDDCTLYELYCGGAGASLNVLFDGVCKKIVLNDIDPHIYSFWYSILNYTDDFLKKIYDTKIDIGTWEKQKSVYNQIGKHSLLEVGFSTFFLNRTNRSGILAAGPIGGKNQFGNYKINARFNKEKLSERIIRIANFKEKIEITKKEAITFLNEVFNIENESSFVFLDPPYYVQGENLYFNFYTDQDHKKLASKLHQYNDKNWFLTYDNCDEINNYYQSSRRAFLPMRYSLENKRRAKEVMIFSNSLKLPSTLSLGNESKPLTMLE